MFDRERKLFAFNLRFLERLAADIPEEQFTTQPAPGMNPPRWILGHLAISTDFCLRMLGKEPALPPAWHASFGPGAAPNAPGTAEPTKDELLAAFRAGHHRVLTALDTADPQFLAQPHGVQFESIELIFPTRGELLAQLMSNHAAFHIGQLSAWRRAAGWSPLF